MNCATRILAQTYISTPAIILSFPFKDVDRHPLILMIPDAKSLVGGFNVKTSSDIWLVENFDPDVQ